MSFLWSEEDLEFLRKNYSEMKMVDLKSRLKRSGPAISSQAQVENLTCNKSKYRIFKCNDSFFKEINPLTCYIAGLIAADGCINEKANCIGFSQKSDYLIKYIKESLNSDATIYYRKRAKTEEYSINFCSKELVKDIANNFNVVPRKSKNGLDIPEIHDLDCIMCYVAGLLDGDGSISFKKIREYEEKKLSFTLLCSKKILDWINKSMNLSMNIQKRNDCKVELYKMNGSYNKARLFLESIYDCLIRNNIKITPKWEKVNENKLLCSDM